MSKDDTLRELLRTVSSVRHLGEAAAIAGAAARRLTGADGIAFIVRDGDRCYYAEETAIAPLWKGSRFPMSRCISGWVMQHGAPACIADVYADERIPQEAYRPTFVKSLAVVPARADRPVGALGAYWADEHRASDAEVELLQAIADACSTALAQAGPQAAASEPPAAEIKLAETTLCVLVVEDDPDAAEGLELLLGILGHQARTAASGAQALALGDTLQPDVVLMDISLPGMDGFETARRMRERTWGRRTRLVALTGWVEPEHRRRALEAGFDAHVTKPAHPAALRAELVRRRPEDEGRFTPPGRG